MFTIYFAIAALVAFVAGVGMLGFWVRVSPTRAVGERASRIAHVLFFAGLGAPFMVALVSPGVTQLDALLGLDPPPMRTAGIVLGVLLTIPGLYFFTGSNKALRALGTGANAFRLTQRVVGADVYRMTRNPMSFGYYLLCLAIGLFAGSTSLTLYVIFGIIPAHIFFLKYFEERELALRFGPSYEQYKRTVPFLAPHIRRRGGATAAQS
jgi:protein-S-isoprenylcysteine O-methyltransferase Ste14